MLIVVLNGVRAAVAVSVLSPLSLAYAKCGR
jgi:hypothetical protein